MLPSKRGKLARRRGTAALGVLAVAGLLTAIGPSLATAATPQKGQVGKWQQAMAKLKVPGKGCFTASYPKVGWARTACKKAPDHPYPPVHGPHPQTVGNGVDISAMVAGQLTSATGSFGSVSPGIAETGQQNGIGPQVANTFSLQLNTKPFMAPACTGSPNPGCQGWEQFVYSTTDNDVFVQYWLLRYNTTCPAGWNTFHFAPPDTDTYCWRNSTSSPFTSAPLTAAGLAGTMLTGSAASGGNDTVAMTTASGHGTATGADSLLHLAGRWQEVEFAVVGDCCGTQANFNAGAAINVRTTVHSGTRMAPVCDEQGFTGETNNLNLTGTPAIGTATAPTIASTQTTTPGSVACATARGIGDVHMHTFNEALEYDFQAAGDYELATTGPQFVVQNRQVSGAPMWPLATVSQAVAARIGPADVALCPAKPDGNEPALQLFVDSKAVDLASGGQFNLPGGGSVARTGDAYLIQGSNGNSVLAQFNIGTPNWIDTTVGVGRWPEPVHGLLANASNHNPLSLQTRGGAILTAPYAFSKFYNDYGKSWRVPANQSLLTPCGGKAAFANPKNIFYANNLDQKVAQAARALCTQAGVKVPALLDGCTIDMAVLNNKAAILPYLSAPANVRWGKITAP
jgi:hypothetical protein